MKKKLLFIGDIIMDMSRDLSTNHSVFSYGSSFVFFIQGELGLNCPKKFEIYNRGIGGDRIVDIYARLKRDCIRLCPDFITILVGVNDVWCEIENGDGIEFDRYERIYSMFIEDVKKYLPNTRIMLITVHKNKFDFVEIENPEDYNNNYYYSPPQFLMRKVTPEERQEMVINYII